VEPRARACPRTAQAPRFRAFALVSPGVWAAALSRARLKPRTSYDGGIRGSVAQVWCGALATRRW